MKRFFRTHYIFSIFIFLFCLLLFKDPFSERTLIPNFEPFPDALYYVASAKNLLNGDGLVVGREHRNFIPPIPPLYSLSLVPAFVVNSDPRVFYFSNVFMAMLSFWLFYRILVLLKMRQLVITLLLFLYVTNYFLYWLPTLAMAENLTLLLYIAFLWLFLSKLDSTRIVLASFLGIGFYATKYASIPLTITFLAIYFLKLFFDWRKNKLHLKNIFLFVFFIILFSTSFFIYEELTKGNSPLHYLKIFTTSLNQSGYSQNSSDASASTTNSWFSLRYVQLNIGHYINSITGGSERFLWDYTPLVSRLVGIGGIIGLFFGLLTKRLRMFCMTLTLSLISSILFMSTLYTFDMRYIYIAIPTLILGFGILLSIIFEKYKTGFLSFCLKASVVLFFISLCVFSAIRIKSQISLNLRYAETPWYYISILKMNEYFTKDKIIQGEKPIVISALPPFLVDFFSNSNYILLPLSYQQEFRNIKEVVWGPNDYSDLPKLYEKYLNEGYNVYLSRYGLGNEVYTNQDFQIIMEKFDTHLEMHGCFEQCNIYKISLKK